MIFPLAANLFAFCIAAAGVWIAGTRLAIYADEIADRKRIGKAFMGFVFLAAATELPELVTTITAAVEGNAALVLSNMFGGIAFQTAILAFADAVAARVALSHYPRKPTPVIEGCFLALLLATLLAIILVGERPLAMNIGIGTLALALCYLFAVYMLRLIESHSAWVPVQIPEIPETNQGITTGRVPGEVTFHGLLVRFCVASVVILFCGVMLVQSAERIAVQSGLGSSFIGLTLLAGSTSLPELSTTIMAVRLHSYTMAISNIFGSNLIMLVLLLPADAFYRQGPILTHVDKSAEYAIVCGVIVTMIYVIGLLVRTKRHIFGMGYDSIAVLVVYFLSLLAFYTLK